MILTAAQLQAIKADIAANSDLNAFPNTDDGNFAIAALYNALTAIAFFVYRTNIPVQDIFDQITWANLTPADAPPAAADTTLSDHLAWQSRALACQAKQFNVQLLLQGQSLVNGAKPNVRAGLQDALTNVPSGAAGALVSGGWVGVRDNALARKATRIEKLFATTAVNHDGSTAAAAATMVIEGAISGADIRNARNS
jgi:hypothetical protein